MHEAYPQQQHPQPYPFGKNGEAPGMPEDLLRSLAEQRRRIEALLATPRVVRSPDTLRAVRAIEVLEHIGSAEARRLLPRERVALRVAFSLASGRCDLRAAKALADTAIGWLPDEASWYAENSRLPCKTREPNPHGGVVDGKP